MEMNRLNGTTRTPPAQNRTSYHITAAPDPELSPFSVSDLYETIFEELRTMQRSSSLLLNAVRELTREDVRCPPHAPGGEVR